MKPSGNVSASLDVFTERFAFIHRLFREGLICLMKLCIVTRSVFKGDGQGQVNYEIVCEAIRRGYQVTIVPDSLAPDLQQKQNK